MKFKELAKKPSSKKLIVTAIAVVGIVLLGWLVYMWYQSVTVNYAQEVAKPLEEALVKAGAKKMCSNGDAGRGPDNRTPWLQDFYYLPMEQQQAEKLMYKVTDENGYKLSHASKESRGPVNVADEFVDMWYYDYSSKTSPYTNLQAGNIKLAVIVDGTGAGYKCSDSVPSNTTVIGVDVKLPNYK